MDSHRRPRARRRRARRRRPFGAAVGSAFAVLSGRTTNVMSAAVRVTLLLILGLVVLGRGLMYLDDWLASASRPAAAPAPVATPAGASTPPAAATPAPVAPSCAAAAHREPAPRASPGRSVGARGCPAQPAGARGDAAAPRGARRRHAPGLHPVRARSRAPGRVPSRPRRRRVARCRLRRGRIPPSPRDVAFRHEGAACLVEVIAALAAEDPPCRRRPRRARD